MNAPMATPRMRPRPTPSHPRAAALSLFVGLAWAGLLGPGAARAGAPDGDTPSTKVAYAGASRDTLAYDWRDVYPAAIEELKYSDWTIQRADTASRRVVTRWKPLKHPLVRVFLGSVMARCVVDVVPLADGRTQLTIQGGLASDSDIEGSAGYAAAVAVYRGATERWLSRVAAALDASARRGLVVRVEPAAPTSARVITPGPGSN